ncbi:hypothetical protein SAMN02799625_05910 [Methylobacterium sp. UNC300MFChir4.1]|nr:hypothetical protein SAMN02799625_05910 [Methylobacterium sp. UNC300MFChir4.1]
MTLHARLGTVGGRTGSLRMADLFRRHDWASTRLGGREAWPAVLRTTVDLMLASLHPMCVMWGPSCIFLYNDGYADILGAQPGGASIRRTASGPSARLKATKKLGSSVSNTITLTATGAFSGSRKLRVRRPSA